MSRFDVVSRRQSRMDLELGLLTPTAGINIFLSSYRFGKPVLQVSRAVIPMQCILIVGLLLLLITYLPALTTFLPPWLGRVLSVPPLH